MRNDHKSCHRHVKSKLAFRVLAIGAVAFAATACSVALTEQKKAQPDGSENLDDSDALVITMKPDAIARVRVPEELLVAAMRQDKALEKMPVVGAPADAAADTSAFESIPVAPGIAVVCAQPREKPDQANQDRRDESGSKGEGMRRIQHMDRLVHGITLRAAVRGKNAQNNGEETIAGISQSIQCRNFAIVMHHLPAGKKLTLRVALSNESMAFTGVTGEFKHEGFELTPVTLRLAKREGVIGPDAGSIVDEIFGDQTNVDARPDVMPVGLVLFKDATAKEVHSIVGDFAARLVCDTKSVACRTESKQIDAEKSARLVELMKSNSMRPLETGALGRFMAIHQLRCSDEQCTGFPLTLR